jgi:glycosyltransferase involved in cell wall biosynthesis
MSPIRPLKVAFIQDALPFIGGAERTLMAALEVFPDAPIYTLVYNPQVFSGTPIAQAKVHTSFIDRLPGAHKHHRWFFPLMPTAVTRMTIPDADIIISFNYAVAHGIIPQPSQMHISYTLTPMRYAYQDRQRFLDRQPSGPQRWITRWALERFRHWDQQAVKGVHQFAAISAWIAGLVRLAYHRSAQVIYPPVEVERFIPSAARSQAFLVVSRLVTHKNIDRIIAAFNKLGKPLWVVGTGPEETRLSRLAQPNVRILGWVPDNDLPALYGQARAVINACEDDFGISMVEALAAGCPVIALAQGAAPEFIQNGVNGWLYKDDSITGIIAAVEEFESIASQFNPDVIRQSAMRFNRERFKSELRDLVYDSW